MAQVIPTGEVINVNYEYKIAFTDINKDALAPGDLVEVAKDGVLQTYLKVVETSAVLSKLGPIESDGSSSYQSDFSKVEVGFQTKKLADAIVPSTAAAGKSADYYNDRLSGIVDAKSSRTTDPINELNDKNMQLQGLLAELLNEKQSMEGEKRQVMADYQTALTRIDALEQQNKALESAKENLLGQINTKEEVGSYKTRIKELNEKIAFLEEKLKQMGLLIEKNLELYEQEQ